jgi:hypothetical protein
VDDPIRVEPIWRRLASRATLLGLRLPQEPATTADPEPRVVIGWRTTEPVSVDAGHYTFVLPKSDGVARLVSRAARPGELRPWVDDRAASVSWCRG